MCCTSSVYITEEEIDNVKASDINSGVVASNVFAYILLMFLVVTIVGGSIIALSFPGTFDNYELILIPVGFVVAFALLVGIDEKSAIRHNIQFANGTVAAVITIFMIVYIILKGLILMQCNNDPEYVIDNPDTCTTSKSAIIGVIVFFAIFAVVVLASAIKACQFTRKLKAMKRKLDLTRG